MDKVELGACTFDERELVVMMEYTFWSYPFVRFDCAHACEQVLIHGALRLGIHHLRIFPWVKMGP